MFKIIALLESVRNMLQNANEITHFTSGMFLHYLGKLKFIFSDIQQTWKKCKQIAFRVQCNWVFWVYLHVCVNRIFETFKHTKKASLFSSIKCGWLWKDPVGYGWSLFALTPACSRSFHSSMASSMTVCGMLEARAAWGQLCHALQSCKLVPAWDARHSSRLGSSLGCLAATSGCLIFRTSYVYVMLWAMLPEIKAMMTIMIITCIILYYCIILLYHVLQLRRDSVIINIHYPTRGKAA